jgi:hypothetical protein
MLKNQCAKIRDLNDPYEVWVNNSGWEWRVLKKWQVDDNKPYARWFCAVKSPMTAPSYDMGDTYVADIKQYAIKVDNPIVEKW